MSDFDNAPDDVPRTQASADSDSGRSGSDARAQTESMGVLDDPSTGGVHEAARAAGSEQARPDEPSPDHDPDHHADEESDADIERWIERAERQLVDVWVRCGPRYARRLEHAFRARDPARDVFTLAARRLLPLPRRLKRALPSVDLPTEARAFLRLVVADRRVLWHWEQRHAFGKAQHLHLLDAVHRLTKQAQAVRKETRAPPAPEHDSPTESAT